MSPAAETLKDGTCVLIEKILDLGARFVRFRALGVEVFQEPGGRPPPRLLAGCLPNGLVRGDDPDLLAASVRSGQALDHPVGFDGEAHGKRPARHVVPDPVEDHDAPGPAERHEAREAVDQLLAVPEVARVKDVVSIEEIEHPDKDARVERESAYLFELVERAQATLADDLVGVYAGGSWALGGYEPGRSDLDVAVVVRSPF